MIFLISGRLGGGAYWRITVKERVIYLGNFSQTMFAVAAATRGEAPPPIYHLLLSSTLQGFPFYPISLLYQFPTPDSISRGYPLIDLSPPLPLLFRIARPPPLPTPPEYLPESRERLLNARKVRGKFCDSSKN